MAIDWKLYYDRKRQPFSSEDGTPAEAPAWGVQIAAQRNADVGVARESRYDYYLYRDGEWLGVDLIGLIDHLADMGIVKVGRKIPRAEWKEIKDIAIADPDFPRKSARLEGER